MSLYQIERSGLIVLLDSLVKVNKKIVGVIFFVFGLDLSQGHHIFLSLFWLRDFSVVTELGD